MTEPLAVVFTKDARSLVADIRIWWEGNRPLAPELFARELERAVERLAVAPTLGTANIDPRLRNVRRLLLPRARYHLYYRVEGGTLVVLAIWHAKRGTEPAL